MPQVGQLDILLPPGLMSSSARARQMTWTLRNPGSLRCTGFHQESFFVCEDYSFQQRNDGNHGQHQDRDNNRYKEMRLRSNDQVRNVDDDYEQNKTGTAEKCTSVAKADLIL